MKKDSYTLGEQIVRIWDKENIKDLMSRHAYYQTNDLRAEELDRIWVSEPENMKSCSLANNYGYFVGMDAIRKYYVEEYEPYSQADGTMNIHTVNTPLIYLAEDGKTAKFLGYDCGQQATGSEDLSAEAYFNFGLIFADLIKENGKWKLWHLILEHDASVPVGGDPRGLDARALFGEDPWDKHVGEPTIPVTVYDPFYGWADLYKKMPKEYDSYTPEYGYGPEGQHPKCTQHDYMNYRMAEK